MLNILYNIILSEPSTNFYYDMWLCNCDSVTMIFFKYQQFITWYMVVDCGSYFVTTYNRRKLHEEMETEERERERRYRELIKEIEKKRKWNGEIRKI